MRVVLAEDLFLLRDGLVRLLQAHDFEIAAAVESGPELARALAELEPDVAVVDVRLPPTRLWPWWPSTSGVYVYCVPWNSSDFLFRGYRGARQE